MRKTGKWKLRRERERGRRDLEKGEGERQV